MHYTANETIGGVEFPYVPDSGAVPLVADMSSTILSRPMPVEKFGLIYAGAQKNIGPAGLVRRDRARRSARTRARPARRRCGTTGPWRLKTRCSTRRRPSRWYVAGLVFKWLQAQGGLPVDGASAIEAKAQLLYAAIDGSGFYRNPVAPAVPLVDERALHAARAASSSTPSSPRRARRGSSTSRATARSAACARASTTRCRSQGVEALVVFMRDFERRHG